MLALDTYPPEVDMAARDIMVIGASLGGVAALRSLAAGLPPAMPAAVMAVLHMSPDYPSTLDAVLRQAGALKVGFASHGSHIEPGVIRLAPPDRHLLVVDDILELSRGPRENMSRPAVDPLFRSAAVAKGSRVVGVVLTGLLDDGTAGMEAIKRCGGVTVVQDPEDAEHPGMPQSVLNSGVEVDFCLPLADIPPLLARLAASEAPVGPTIPEDLKSEVEMLRDGYRDQATLGENGWPSGFICPECGGALFEMTHGKTPRYRCRIGHAYTGKTLMADQWEAAEKALVAAVRTMDERAKFCDRMAVNMRDQNRESLAREYLEQAEEMRAQVEVLRGLLVKGRQA